MILFDKSLEKEEKHTSSHISNVLFVSLTFSSAAVVTLNIKYISINLFY